MIPYYFQSIAKDFTARCKGIVQEAMKWAPQITKSHLQEYIRRSQYSSSWYHASLGLKTNSILELIGFPFTNAPQNTVSILI